MKIFGIQIGKENEIQNVENVSKKVNENVKVTSKIINREMSRSSQDVGKWRSATLLAESLLNPNRYNLYQIYKDVVLDSHLSALMKTIELKVLSGEYWICNADGSINEELTNKLKKPWFKFYLEQHITAIFYGHALIQLGDIVNDEFKDFEIVPRENVVPEFGIVKDTTFTHATDGVKYREQPYSDYLIEIGNKTDLGLLHKASPLVLWKKGIFGAWSHFAELFGMPVRIGKTDILNPTNKANMQTMLANMGSASWGVLNTDDMIEFIESSNNDSYQVYLEFINLINAELSKLVLGQTGTTDEKSFVGSAQVHNDILNVYVTAVKSKIESHFMSAVLPKLFMFGMFPKSDIHFKWNNEEQISKQAHFDITKELLKFYNVPAEWINETFNVPVEDKVSTLDQNKSVIPAIQNLYKGLNNAE